MNKTKTKRFNLRLWVQVSVILLCGLAIYSNSLSGPFLFDDSVVITGEPSIQNFKLNWASGRVVTDFTFALNYYLHGESTTGYHAVNLLLHLISGLLVFALVILLFRTPFLSTTTLSAKSKQIGFLASILFVAHPIQTQAVSYIAQRYTAMAALFYLAAICLYIVFRLSTAEGFRKFFYYAGFLLCVVLAFKSKQNAATLPFAIIMVEMLFFSGSLKQRALYLSPFIVAFFAGIIYFLGSDITLQALSAKTRLGTIMPRDDYLLTQFRVITTYLRLLVFPINQNLDHDYPVFDSILNPEVFLSGLLHLGLLLTAGYTYIYSRTKNHHLRIFTFGILWFYLTLAIESSFIPIVDVIYEHRIYLPSVGFFLIFAAAFYQLAQLKNKKPIQIVIITTLVLILGLSTYNRNSVWQSGMALWSDTVSKSPNKPRPLNNLGIEYFNQNDYKTALKYFQLALAKDPRYMKAYFNAGESCQKMGRYQQALTYYRIFVSARPDYPETYKNLADVYQNLGQEQNSKIYLKIYDKMKGKTLPSHYR